MQYAIGILSCTFVIGHIACTSPASKAPRKTAVKEQLSHHQTSFDATVTEVHYGKPPLAYLTVDAVLHNDWSGPRWFVIPTTIPRISGPPSSGVYAVEFSTIGGPQNGGLVAELHGIDSVYVALIPSGGELILKGLQIHYWYSQRHTNSVSMIVRVASEVSIGPELIRQWLDSDPLNRGRAEGDYSHRKLLSKRGNLGYKEVPLNLTDEVTLSRDVALISPHRPAELPLPTGGVDEKDQWLK
jgi:hypothetical protein